MRRCLALLQILIVALALCLPSQAQRLHVTGLQAVPKKITLKWDAPPQGPFGPPSQDPANAGTPGTITVAIVWSALQRSPGSTVTPAVFPYTFGSNTQLDDTDWQLNTVYDYWLVGSEVRYSKAYNTMGGYWYWSGPSYIPWESPKIHVEVKAKAASAAATADSRLDMRFATEQLLDYKFNALPASDPVAPTYYRGGLFAGYQQDGSRVGRSYLRFNTLVTTPDPNIKLWPVGGLQIFVPRLARTGSVTLTTRKLSDETFSPSSLVWSNAPTMGTTMARSSAITWNATSPTKQWVSINVSPDIQDAVNTDGNLSLSLLSNNETSTGWAYIARPGYTDPTYTLPAGSLTPPDGLAPFLLYAVLGPGADLATISVSPNTVTSGTSTTVTGTVTISAIAPTGGLEVSLGSNNSAVSVPNSVVIPAGQSSANFAVSWSSVTTTTAATITAIMGNMKTAGLTIEPASGGGGGGGGSGDLANLSISPGAVPSGTSATGTVTLSSAAPTGGIAVSLSSSNTSAAQVPASVTVPAGQTTKIFTITTGPGYAYYQPATITATSTNSKTASLYVYPGYE